MFFYSIDSKKKGTVIQKLELNKVGKKIICLMGSNFVTIFSTKDSFLCYYNQRRSFPLKCARETLKRITRSWKKCNRYCLENRAASVEIYWISVQKAPFSWNNADIDAINIGKYLNTDGAQYRGTNYPGIFPVSHEMLQLKYEIGKLSRFQERKHIYHYSVTRPARKSRSKQLLSIYYQELENLDKVRTKAISKEANVLS